VPGWGVLGMSDTIPVTVLMGGEEQRDWHLQPEVEQVLIGTQDMLLSRALNRGYASSPFRWPWEFGLLNNDCLWVMDEVQLMGNGLPTSTQLQAFRERLGVSAECRTLWMSATVAPEWLGTVDFAVPAGDDMLTLGAEDEGSPTLQLRQQAAKTLERLAVPDRSGLYDASALAQSVREFHSKGSMTLIVVNTVSRAQRLYDALQRLPLQAELVLVHSRYRPIERRSINSRVVAPVTRRVRDVWWWRRKPSKQDSTYRLEQ
jgi:CRISPR-associated endonuclease/helicase Cas3